tara:strand:- start:34623 stop:36278 length:1656 start_codon:yes stop_codon:yes gene_type:complete
VKLRRQLLLFGLGTTAVFSLLSLVAIVLLQTTTLPTVRDNVRRKTIMSIDRLAQLDVAIATNDIEEIARAVTPLAADSELRYVRFLDSEGTELYTYGSRPKDISSPVDGVVRQKKGLAIGAREVVFEGLPLGNIELAYSTSATDTLRMWIRTVSIVAILFVIASFIASVKFSASIVHPINSMVKFTKEVREGNLLDHVPQHVGAWEMRLLAHHLNIMSRAIHQRDLTLAKQQAKLEANLQTIHETREQLLSSTRLAAVGEMAGRTAHEVLNPVSSMHGRLTRITETTERVNQEELGLIQEILSCWQSDYQEGGFEKLLSGFKKPCADDPQKALFTEDMENLGLFFENLDSQSSELQQDLAFLLKEIDRITHIVDGMRSMARSSGTAEAHEVRALLRESVDILQDGFKKRNIMADIVCSGDLVVCVDRYELIQVITNLMRNSMLAIEEDRGRLGGLVTLRAESSQGSAFIYVEDDGPGISEEHKAFLFESNFTTRGSSDGTGLGLAIARRLVRAVEGDLTLHHSALGKGAVFQIALPTLLDVKTGETNHVTA